MVITTNTGEKIVDVFYQRIPKFIEGIKVGQKKIGIVVALVLKKNVEHKYLFARKEDLQEFITKLGVNPNDVLKHLDRNRVVEEDVELSENNLELLQFLERISRGMGSSIFKENVKKKIEQMRIGE